jgi:hypothetical protein
MLKEKNKIKIKSIKKKEKREMKIYIKGTGRNCSLLFYKLGFESHKENNNKNRCASKLSSFYLAFISNPAGLTELCL